MTAWREQPLISLGDVERFESAVPLLERIPQRSVYEVLVQAAAQHGDRTAFTMVMTGEDDEQPRRVSFVALLGLVTRTANLVTSMLVIFASKFGMPVSTTHVSCGSLFGIGAVTRQAKWKTIFQILTAWLTTLPVAAILGAGCFLAIRAMIG